MILIWKLANLLIIYSLFLHSDNIYKWENSEEEAEK
jgi:hypothetical protein